VNNCTISNQVSKINNSVATVSNHDYLTSSNGVKNDDAYEVFCGGIEYKINKNDDIESLCVFITTRRLISITQLRGNYFHTFFTLFFYK